MDKKLHRGSNHSAEEKMKEEQLKDLNLTVHTWVYGPENQFSSGSRKDLPDIIRRLGYVRVGYISGMLKLPARIETDILFTLGDKEYLGKKIGLVDFSTTNLSQTQKLHMDGIILCEYTSRKGLNTQSSKTESVEPAQLSHKDGGNTGTPSTIEDCV